MPYIPHTDKERQEMLSRIGVNSIDELLTAIPERYKYPQLRIGPGLSEAEVAKKVNALSERNLDVDHVACFAGGGAYNHFIPAAVKSVTSRNEFYTSYTPYQAEVSQGTLQSIYEFQTMIAALMGMDVANASMYDGATAAAEGALMAVHYTRRPKIVIVPTFHPEWVEVIRTFTSGVELEIVVAGELPDNFKSTPRDIATYVDERTACVLVQYPNFFGSIEDIKGYAALAHSVGALLVVAAYPIALGLLKPPGELGADIAVGEGQSLGNELNFGGPYLGLFATRKDFIRYMPGRLVGATKDVDGKRGYVLTLQTREQHIRREKATSNICTNEALNALASTVYLSLMGKQGLAKVAQLCVNNAHYLAGVLSAVPGWEVISAEPFFNEFVLKCPVPASQVVSALIDEGILAGIDLGRFDSKLSEYLLVCATEMNTKEEMDRYASLISNVKAVKELERV